MQDPSLIIATMDAWNREYLVKFVPAAQAVISD